MTGLIALCQNATQVYVCRIFLGLMESSAWPGMMTIFMYWYTPAEIAKRMGFYHSCQAIGSMMSGAISTAILDTVDGAHGIAGWRWLFIINCVMTIFVGAAGFFMLPDYPHNPNPRAFWFTATHARIAQGRLEREGRSDAKKITWSAAKRAAKLWVAYLIPILYITTVIASYGYNYFNLFLKSVTNADGTKRWSTSQVNSIPIGGGAINVAFVWIWAILSDVLQTRWTLIVVQAVIGLVPAIIMSIWTRHSDSTPISAAYASYFISYMCLGTAPLIMAWLSDILPRDPEARTLILGGAISGTYAVIAWSQVLVWPAAEAPHYRFAWQVSIALWCLVIAIVVLLRIADIKYLLYVDVPVFCFYPEFLWLNLPLIRCLRNRPKRLAEQNTVVAVSKDDAEEGAIDGVDDAKRKDTESVA